MKYCVIYSILLSLKTRRQYRLQKIGRKSSLNGEIGKMYNSAHLQPFGREEKANAESYEHLCRQLSVCAVCKNTVIINLIVVIMIVGLLKEVNSQVAGPARQAVLRSLSDGNHVWLWRNSRAKIEATL